MKTCSALLCLVLLTSCAYFKKDTKKEGAAIQETASSSESEFIGMDGEQVKKRLGEPNIVSRSPGNCIIWTYKPSWKIMPDDKGTMYVEFENGKVIRIKKIR